MRIIALHKRNTMSSNLGLHVCLLVGVIFPLSLDAIGIDVSRSLDNYDFKDFMEAGITEFVIFKGYGGGSVNPNAINDSIGAYEAGFNNFDMCLSPCPRCNKTAAEQVKEMGMFDSISTLKNLKNDCIDINFFFTKMLTWRDSIFSQGYEWCFLWTYLAGCHGLSLYV